MHRNTPKRTAFCRAIKKYGDENFQWEILSRHHSKAELDAAEITAIAQHRTLAPHGYNLMTGGANGKHSPENREKISRLHIARFADPAYRKKFTESVRAKFAADPDRQKQLADLNASRPNKPLWAKRQAAAMRKRWRDPVYRASMTGRKKT